MRKLVVSAGAAIAIAIASSGVGHAAAMTADMHTVFTSATKLVDEYWTAHYSDFFEGTYATPRVIPPGERGQTGCGPANPNDAFYCSDDVIAIGDNFLGDAAELGDLFIYEVVGHEWGHAVQERLKIPRVELDADCFAGAVLGSSYKAGNKALEGGDGAAMKKIFDRGGDSRPASRPSDHGTSQQRLEWYMKGWNQGPTACVDSKLVKAQPPKPTPSTPTLPPVAEPDPAPGGTTPPAATPPPVASQPPALEPTIEETTETAPGGETGSSELLDSFGSLS